MDTSPSNRVFDARYAPLGPYLINQEDTGLVVERCALCERHGVRDPRTGAMIHKGEIQGTTVIVRESCPTDRPPAVGEVTWENAAAYQGMLEHGLVRFAKTMEEARLAELIASMISISGAFQSTGARMSMAGIIASALKALAREAEK